MQSRHNRKAFLKKGYFFECECSLCLSDPNGLPEAYRTARRCKCGEMIIGTRTECPKCKSQVLLYSQEECDSIRTKFDQGDKASRLQLYRSLRDKLYPTHWLYVILQDGVFNDDLTKEHTEEFIPFLCDIKTGRLHRAVLMTPFEEAMSIFPIMAAIGQNEKTRHLITEDVFFYWLFKFHRGLNHDSPFYKQLLASLQTQENNCEQ